MNISKKSQYNTKASKNTIAYAYIKEKIINNEFKCGDIISENSLAAELNMSRTPVREAIQALNNEGYVEIHKGIGILIKHVTLKEMYDISAVRVLLESYAITNAAGSIQPYQLDEIIAQWEKLRKKILDGLEYESQEIFDLDAQTHSLFVEFSGNDVLRQLVDNLELKIRRYQKMFTKIANNDLSTVEQHIEILQSIKNKDVKKACSLLEKHILTPLNTVFDNNKLDIY